MRITRTAAAIAAAATLTVVAAACSSSGSTNSSGGGSGNSSSGTPKHGGTVTVAWISATPNFIFPLPPATNTDGYNGNLSNALWPPLTYSGDGAQSIVNTKESLFSSITYSNGNKTATMVLKPWKWSDGQPITSRDFTFVYNLLKPKADYTNWNGYLPGEFPVDVASVSAPDTHTVVINFSQPTSPDFFTDDVLVNVSLLPQHAWDKTSASSPVGDYDTTAAGAEKVFAYLQKEGSNMATFTTNPLWKVVDGPWTLSDFNSDGSLYGYVPNTNYSGSTKPYLAHWENKSYASDTAMIDDMRAGNVTVGNLPLNDVGQIGLLKSQGYSDIPLPLAGVPGIVPNLWNAQDGPVFRQLYLRQAMEDLINRPQIVQKVYSGYADVGNGPIPVSLNPWVSPLEKSGGPYPYNPQTAINLLKQHGWNVTPNGVTTCQSPGAGANQCGAGIAAGQKLEFQLLYFSGSTTTDEQEAAIQADEAAAGIKLDLKSEPFNTVLGTTGVCSQQSHSQNCGWQLADLGYNPYGMYPNDVGMFATGGNVNYGGYSDPNEDKLITQTDTSSGMQTFYQYEDYTAQQLPVLWVPLNQHIVMYKSNLGGFGPLNSFSGRNTEELWWIKS
jgi:peptide/nickel transport system substrate-binding protein